MGQERCECRRCRNRHCRQQKQTASKGHRKLFSVCQKKLRSQNGMTLTELLAAIVILLLSFAGLRLDMSQFAVPM